MKKTLTTNLGLKILAILFSIVIWFIVVNINDPVDKTVFRNIPVEIQNADVITGEGKVYEVLNSSDMIDVTIWAKRSILDTLGKDNIIATADMQEMNFMDTMVRIKLSTNKYNDKLESIKSSTENLEVNIEDMKKVQFVIETTTTGAPAEGYILGNVSSDQNLVRLSGPNSLISKVNRAEVSVDVSGLSQDIHTDASLRLYDKDGNQIEDKNIKKSLDQVKVNIEILQTKRVPVSFTAMGVPAEGYALSGVIESDPSTVLIAGKSNTIKNISQIEVPDSALNVTGQSSNMTSILEIKKFLPENVTLADSKFSGKINVTVHIEKEESDEIILHAKDISLTGMPEGMNGEIHAAADDITIGVKGLAQYMDTLDKEHVTASVDVADFMQKKSMPELSEGSYDMDVILNLPQGVQSVETLSVRVAVTKSETQDEMSEKQN